MSLFAKVCAEFGREGIVYAIHATTGEVTPLTLEEYNRLVDSTEFGEYQVRLDHDSALGLGAAIRDAKEMAA